jgi:hypothetical protein
MPRTAYHRNFAKCLVQRIAEQLTIELRARQPIAMLTRERAAELDHQILDRLGDCAHFGNIDRVFEVDQRSCVHQPDAGVAVERDIDALIVDDASKIADVFA